MQEINVYRANNLHYEIGKLVKKEEQLESKYALLRDRILGHNDFAKKQDYEQIIIQTNFTLQIILEQLRNNYSKQNSIKMN